MGGCLSYRLKLIRDQVPIDDTLFQHLSRFLYKSLRTATNDFSKNGVIRKNGFSTSYRGTLVDGSKVIVKVYHDNLKLGVMNFTSMVKAMSGVMHQNVLELIGWCVEGDHRMVVLQDYGEEYSLDHLLFISEESGVGHDVIDWPRRVSILQGIVRALDYCHNGISPRIVLRDVKTSNFFVDCNSNPRLVDFETSYLLEGGVLDHNDYIYGTLGYLDPEYVMTGVYSDKTDVYAFGITLLEIINGTKNIRFVLEHEGSTLMGYAWELRTSGRILEIVDPNLFEFSEDEVARFVNVALACVQLSSSLRPNMSEVRVMLSDGYDFSNMELVPPELRIQPYSSMQHSSRTDELLLQGPRSVGETTMSVSSYPQPSQSSSSTAPS